MGRLMYVAQNTAGAVLSLYMAAQNTGDLIYVMSNPQYSTLAGNKAAEILALISLVAIFGNNIYQEIKDE